ncbi:Sulfotransferase family protein [Poseidonocella pacifica]|uniref:Sulfotransferase family protein n=1 Tax=Poseidonocella pacifica TaxID=871651 RepID=A0A1I0XSX1_9RHOB|nr:sulfotransferase family 2 domain-containing protein [Poseidonocella pacifica]SFB04249.1 Sulfotransferase family protein [Poseidonocella pacifica]
MMKKKNVVTAYRFFLGRRPSDEEVKKMVARKHNLESLRRAFLASDEFKNKVAPKFRLVESAEAPAGDSSAELLIHLHVPKTAGTTLSSVLQQVAAGGPRMTVGTHDIHRLEELPAPRRAALRFVFGHLNHGVDRYFTQKCTYVTVLRQPGPRILSFFNYCKRIEHHPLHAKINSAGMSFGDFLEHVARTGDAQNEIDNGQVRRLSGFDAAAGAELQQQFSAALGNIFAANMHYGLSEHFGEFLDRLQRRGLIPGFENSRQNAAPEPTDIASALAKLTPKQKRIYDAFTIWDDCFYNICEAAFFAPDEP